LPFCIIGKDGGFDVAGVIVAFADVRPTNFRFLIGLLLFDLALLSSELESVFSSTSSSIGICEAAFFLADRVTGPKYPSCDDSLVLLSEGVGDGDMTLGVAGIAEEE